MPTYAPNCCQMTLTGFAAQHTVSQFNKCKVFFQSNGVSPQYLDLPTIYTDLLSLNGDKDTVTT